MVRQCIHLNVKSFLRRYGRLIVRNVIATVVPTLFLLSHSAVSARFDLLVDSAGTTRYFHERININDCVSDNL